MCIGKMHSLWHQNSSIALKLGRLRSDYAVCRDVVVDNADYALQQSRPEETKERTVSVGTH